VQQAPLVQPAQQDLQVPLEPVELKDPSALEARLARLVVLDQLVQLGPPDRPDQLAQWALQV
jgi:hypothetical protein